VKPWWATVACYVLRVQRDGFIKNERVLVELLVELVKYVVLTMKVHVESRHVVGVLDVEGLGFVGAVNRSRCEA
jgi:hypothetical protein